MPAFSLRKWFGTAPEQSVVLTVLAEFAPRSYTQTVTEVQRTGGPDRVAGLLVRNARLSLVMSAAMAGIGLADLFTGALLDEWRIDVALLIAAAMSVEGVFSRRRLAARLRHGETRRPATLRIWLGMASSLAMSVALGAVVGYLLAGWILAVAIPGATLAIGAAALGFGIRQRRQRRLLG